MQLPPPWRKLPYGGGRLPPLHTSRRTGAAGCRHRPQAAVRVRHAAVPIRKLPDVYDRLPPPPAT